jgi:catechol 2,3-dioxygenase-like lactoylglutathione lyase family enzyme
MPCALSFVQLTVPDWPAAVAWYRDVLGLELVLRDDAGSFALFQAGPARLALKAGEASADAVLLAFEVEDLSGWLARLAGHGVTPEGPVRESAEGYRRAVVRDPAGCRVSLFEWLAPRGPGASVAQLPP